MENKKIGILNDEFDLKIALKVIRRSIPLLLILVVLGGVIGFLMNRYTPRLYNSSAVIKIGMDETTNQLYGINNIYEKPISGEIGLIQSTSLIRSALKGLPLDVNYVAYGRFLDFENYRTSPFRIEYQNKTGKFIDKKVFIKFLSPRKAAISFYEDYSSADTLPLNHWVSLPDIEINVRVSKQNLKKIFTQLHNQDVKGYHFTINSEQKIISTYRKNMNVSIVNASAKTIRIAFTGNSQQRCADLANAMAREFIHYDVVKKSESANQMISYMEQQSRILDQKLGQFEEFMSKNANSEDVQKGKNLLNSLKAASSRIITESQDDEMIIEMQIEELKKLKKEIASQSLNTSLFISPVLASTVVSDKINSIQELLMQRQQALYTYKEASPEINQIDFNIKLQMTELSRIIDNLIYHLEKKLNDINKTEQEEVPDTKPIDDDEDSENTASDLRRITRLYSMYESYYSKFISQKAEYEIVKAGFVPKNDIIDRATTNNTPIKPITKTNYLISVGGAFAIGLIVMIVRYLFENNVNSLSDVQKHVKNASILGMIPQYKENIPVSQLIVDKNPKSLITEAFRSIRSNLQFINSQKGPKVMAVTSTVSGEGKTFVAINIGGIIAFSGKKVIILDLDMRKPKTHIGFNVDNSIGMSTLLIGKSTLEGSIKKSNLENLDFITAGPIPPNPSELIISEKMNNVIEELKQTYDVIVIDNPPIGIVSDALPIIRKADYPIYILRAEFSKKMFLQNLNSLIEKNEIRHLSVILNAAGKSKSYGYGYGYGNGYGYGYGYYAEDEEKEKSRWFKLFKKS